MASGPSGKMVVVGAGIVGTSIAYEMQKRGRSVILIDENAPGFGASWGNMSSIAVSEFMAVARPAIWRQIPFWLANPEAPVRVRPGYLPRLVPWFAKFLAASRPARVREIEAQGAALCARALGDTRALLDEIGFSDHLSPTGCLSLYASQAEFRADSDRREMLDRFGVGYEVLDQTALRDLEPEISDSIFKAVLLPDNRTLRDPYLVVQRLAEVFASRGGQILRARVCGFERGERISGVRLADGTLQQADEVVLCAGAFTDRLSRLLGEPIPLETERGYSTTIHAPGITLAHSLIWPARAFMVSPTGGGIRVGGTVEMAGLEAPSDFARARITVRHAQTALPNLAVSEATEWMGHRPALPDTVPIISASARTRGLYYATGHGHLGVTHAATTARLIGQLIAGDKTDLDLTPYRINRF